MKLRKAPLTNVELVESMMEFSNFGAVAQIFIMNAIQVMAKEVSEIPIEELNKAFEGHMIHPEAWQGVAKEILEKMKERK